MRVAGVIRTKVNGRDVPLEYARVLHKTVLIPVITYGRDNVTEGGEI